MKAILKRAFIAAGLFTIAAPGMAAEHLSFWDVIGLGALTGLVTAVIASYGNGE